MTRLWHAACWWLVSMLRNRGPLTTRMSLFLAIGVIAACTSTSDEPSLAGSITCGSASCGSGEICVEDEHDLGPGSDNPQYYDTCVAPTAGCSLAACGNSGDPSCASCVVDMCTPFGGKAALHDRTLSCVSF